ncbi:MAG: heme o synthase [Lysobacterales bacterium]
MATGEIVIGRHVVPWRRLYDLTKPKVVFLILFTALVGMLLASPGLVPPVTLFAGLAGIGLAAASGAAINHIVDQRIDALMERTQDRPLPTGDVDPRQAIVFAVSLMVVSMTLLVAFVNTLTAILTFIAMIGYAVIYTVYLKRATPQNIVWGGAAGAAPPLLGWTAVTGELGTEALLLFLIIFVWTPPHFWALAIRRRDEYAKAGVPMLPVTHGIRFTKQQVLLYTLMLLAVSMLPFVTRMSGLLYLAGAVSLGLVFVWRAFQLYRSEGDALAMKTFAWSIYYLTLLFAFLLADHYARLLIRWLF